MPILWPPIYARSDTKREQSKLKLLLNFVWAQTCRERTAVVQPTRIK
jgi:hypothetical protein